MLIDSLIFSLIFLEPESGIPRESEAVMLNFTLDYRYRVCTSGLETEVDAEHRAVTLFSSLHCNATSSEEGVHR